MENKACELCGYEKEKITECRCGKSVCEDCFDEEYNECTQCVEEWKDYFEKS